MASNAAKVTYIGTEDDPHTQVITDGGVTFVKGEAVSVRPDYMHGGVEWLRKFRDNPTFAVDDEDDDVPDNEGERDALMKALDHKAVKYRLNATTDSLRALLASHTDTGA